MTEISHDHAAAFHALAAGLPGTVVQLVGADMVVRLVGGGELPGSGPSARLTVGARVDAAASPEAQPVVLEHTRAALAGETRTYAYASAGSGREWEVTASPYAGAVGELVLVVARDVTERNASTRTLRRLAEHDVLTELPNRRRFAQEVARYVAIARRHGPQGAVLVIDLDDFKYVNQTLGHAAGDDLLVLVAGVLRSRVSGADVIARLGGDEFAVLLPHVDEGSARRVAATLVCELRGRVHDGADTARRVTASVGVALITGSEARPDDVIGDADLAMYEAKQAGGDGFATFTCDGGAEPELRSRVRWIDRIEKALAEDRFELMRQPIVDLSSGEVIAHEVLLRMIDERGERVAPGAFLPVAERFGQIGAIDRWVIDHAIRVAARHGGSYNVNLSAKSLSDPGLVDAIAGLLALHDVAPDRLTFEITETAAVANLELARGLARGLHDLGCRLALDDFGAGFASFSQLKHLPVDVIKIDGEFVQACTSNRTDQLVIDAVVRMARGLGIETIAEFTADEETVELLHRSGVVCGQGFFFGMPAPFPSDVRPGPSTELDAVRPSGA